MKELRTRRGWTQSDLILALKQDFGLEMHQTTLTKLERAARPTTVQELWALATVLDSDPSDLLPPITHREVDSIEIELRAASRQAERARVEVDLAKVQTADAKAREAAAREAEKISRAREKKAQERYFARARSMHPEIYEQRNDDVQ